MTNTELEREADRIRASWLSQDNVRPLTDVEPREEQVNQPPLPTMYHYHIHPDRMLQDYAGPNEVINWWHTK